MKLVVRTATEKLLTRSSVSLNFMEAESSSPHPQQPTTPSYPELYESSTGSQKHKLANDSSVTSILISFFHIKLGLPKSFRLIFYY
jgi:hypothetical protein